MPYNVRSRENLKPRELYYEEKKKPHEVTVTAAGWDGFKGLASERGLSASELIERLGRGTVSLQDAMGSEPKGDTLELSITKWGIDAGQGVDSQGRRYAVKRLKDAP